MPGDRDADFIRIQRQQGYTLIKPPDFPNFFIRSGEKHRTDTLPAFSDGERLAIEQLSPTYPQEHNFENSAELTGLEIRHNSDGMFEGLFS